MKFANGTEQAIANELFESKGPLPIEMLVTCGIARNSIQARLDDMASRGLLKKMVLYELSESVRAEMEKSQ
jgi:hypothetical protein